MNNATQSAQISQKQDEHNVYVIMKTICTSGYHRNGFAATHALGYMMCSYTLLVPMNQRMLNKLCKDHNISGNIYIYIYLYIYYIYHIYIYMLYYIYAYIWLCTIYSIYIYMPTHIYTHICIYTYICIYMYIYIYIYIFIYNIHIDAWPIICAPTWELHWLEPSLE